MKSLLIYAHFNAENTVSSYVFHTLNHFLKLNFNIVFATTSPLNNEASKKLAAKGIKIINVENIGYDFYAWKTAIVEPSIALDKFERLVLLNSSVYGPFFSLKKFLSNLEQKNAEVIGATLSYENKKHIQSYFFYFKKSALESKAFNEYWNNFIPYSDRQNTIDAHEFGFSAHLESSGLKLDAFYKAEDNLNPTLIHPEALYKAQLPFFKFTKISKRKHGLVLLKLMFRYVSNFNKI